jgi:hypothetical protein
MSRASGGEIWLGSREQARGSAGSAQCQPWVNPKPCDKPKDLLAFDDDFMFDQVIRYCLESCNEELEVCALVFAD